MVYNINKQSVKFRRNREKKQNTESTPKHDREFELAEFIFVSVSRESIEFTVKRDSRENSKTNTARYVYSFSKGVSYLVFFCPFLITKETRKE